MQVVHHDDDVEGVRRQSRRIRVRDRRARASSDSASPTRLLRQLASAIGIAIDGRHAEPCSASHSACRPRPHATSSARPRGQQAGGASPATRPARPPLTTAPPPARRGRRSPVRPPSADDHAHWKLKPPSRPSTSRISPTRYRPGHSARLHRAVIDLVQRHAAGRHLGVVVAAAVADVERRVHERVAPAPGARHVSGAPAWVARRCRPRAAQRSATAAGSRVASTVATWARRRRSRACSRSQALQRLVRLARADGSTTPRSTPVAARATVARCQCRDMFSATGPLMPKCVHSSAPVSDVARAAVARAASASPDANARPAPRAVAVEHQRRQRRRGVHELCPSDCARRSRSRRCRSSAATARRSPAPRRGARTVRPSASSTAKRRPAPVDRRHARRRLHDRRPAGAPRAAARRARSRARLVSGKSLPSSSSCSATPSSSKNSRRAVGGKRAQHVRTTRGEPPQKSRSVTTRLVTLQREPPLTRIFAPMRAAPSRHTHAQRRRRARREDRRGQPGRSGAHDHDVATPPCCVIRAGRARGRASARRGRADGRPRATTPAARSTMVPTVRPRKSRRS